MRRKSKRALLYAVGLLVVVAAGVILIPRLLAPPLEAEIARDLHIPAENLVLNIPPGPQRFPGSIFVAGKQFVPVDLMNAGDPTIIRGQDFNTEWKLKDWASAEGSVAVSVASELARNEAAREVSISLRHARLLEMKADDVKARVQRSASARSRGSDHLVVIVRSVEAIPAVRITRNRNASLAQWIAVKDRAGNVPDTKVAVDGQAGDEDALVFEGSEPVVFAFEIAKADYVIENLGPQSDPGVKVNPLTARQLRRLQETGQ